MAARNPTAYRLTSALVADHVGAGVMCFAVEGLGRRYKLHARRPGRELNCRPFRTEAGIEWRADLPSGAAHKIEPIAAVPGLVRVEIVGALEQRAGYYDQPNGCTGWSDGHDAVADRLCAAFEEGDVLLVVDSPGGAAAEIPANVRRALAVKTKHGRRCIGFGKPMIGSAATWWAMALCDEIFGESDSEFGSIGARGEHLDVSGMMAKEGLVKTYFADPPEKVALAPEFPLSPVGAMRGNRDVKTAADAFRAAVCASPIGLRYGLSPEFLIELGADMLTGEAAHAAGLMDGVAPIEDVTAYALQLASESASTREQARARAQAPRRAAR